MANMIVVLSDHAGDKVGGNQSFKVNIPQELEGKVLAKYYVNRYGEWREKGKDKVVAVSTTIVRVDGS